MAMAEASLYRRLLGPAYAELPALLQSMHDVAPMVTAEGFGTVTHGDNPVSRLLARWLRLPAPGIDRPLWVGFRAEGGVERLSRHYADATLTTRQAPGGPEGSGLLAERFAPLSLLLRLQASCTGLDFHLQSVRWGRLTLPRGCRPQLAAREHVEDGWYRFDVQVGLPGLGLLIGYRGRLRRVDR